MCDILDWDFALFILLSSHIIMSDKLGWDLPCSNSFITHTHTQNMCDQLGWDFALLILPLSQRIMSDMPYFITTIIRCVACWVGI